MTFRTVPARVGLERRFTAQFEAYLGEVASTVPATAGRTVRARTRARARVGVSTRARRRRCMDVFSPNVWASVAAARVGRSRGGEAGRLVVRPLFGAGGCP